jgi:hypothetical protein
MNYDTVLPDHSVVFYKMHKKTLEVTDVAEFEGVYWDQLQEIFTHVTGLYTSLGTLKNL